MCLTLLRFTPVLPLHPCFPALPLLCSFTPVLPRYPCFAAAQEEEKKQGSLSKEEIKKPDPAITEGMRHGTYDKLDDDGLCPPGAESDNEPVPSAMLRNWRPPLLPRPKP